MSVADSVASNIGAIMLPTLWSDEPVERPVQKIEEMDTMSPKSVKNPTSSSSPYSTPEEPVVSVVPMGDSGNRSETPIDTGDVTNVLKLISGSLGRGRERLTSPDFTLPAVRESESAGFTEVAGKKKEKNPLDLNSFTFSGPSGFETGPMVSQSRGGGEIKVTSVLPSSVPSVIAPHSDLSDRSGLTDRETGGARRRTFPNQVRVGRDRFIVMAVRIIVLGSASASAIGRILLGTWASGNLGKIVLGVSRTGVELALVSMTLGQLLEAGIMDHGIHQLHRQ